MTLPRTKKNAISRIIENICIWLVNIKNTNSFQSLIKPIVITVPVVIVTQIGINWGASVETNILDVIPKFPIDFFKKNSILIIFFVLIVNYLLNFLSIFATKRAKIKENDVLNNLKDMLEIYGYIDELNDTKQVRFANAQKKFDQGKITDPIELFQEFTLPEQQIYSIVAIIRKAFEALDPISSNIRVGLIEVENSKPKREWSVYLPNSGAPAPMVNPEIFSNRICSIARAIKQNNII